MGNNKRFKLCTRCTRGTTTSSMTTGGRETRYLVIVVNTMIRDPDAIGAYFISDVSPTPSPPSRSLPPHPSDPSARARALITSRTIKINASRPAPRHLSCASTIRPPLRREKEEIALLISVA